VHSTSHLLYKVGDLKVLGAGAEWVSGVARILRGFYSPTIWWNDWNASPEARNGTLDEPSRKSLGLTWGVKTPLISRVHCGCVETANMIKILHNQTGQEWQSSSNPCLMQIGLSCLGIFGQSSVLSPICIPFSGVLLGLRLESVNLTFPLRASWEATVLLRCTLR